MYYGYMTLSHRGSTDMTTGPAWRFETPAALARAIDKYFKDIKKDDITQSGLCLELGVCKSTLNRYLHRPGYEDIVAMAKLRIENAYEVALREKGGAGNIFALKNFGWVDSVSHEHSGNAANPIITKIVREVVNVQQLEYAHAPAVDFSDNYDNFDNFDDDDFLL